MASMLSSNWLRATMTKSVNLKSFSALVLGLLVLGAIVSGPVQKGYASEANPYKLFEGGSTGTFQWTLCVINSDDYLLCSGDSALIAGGLEVLAQVPYLGKVRDFSIGAEQACAVETDGSLHCWGRMGTGASGTQSKVIATEIPTSRKFARVEVAFEGAYLFDLVGAISWLDFKTLGVSELTGLKPFKDIETSGWTRRACGIDMEDQLWCWGLNSAGHLGTGDLESRGIEVPALILSNVRQVEMDPHRTCASTLDNSLFCWGRTKPLKVMSPTWEIRDFGQRYSFQGVESGVDATIDPNVVAIESNYDWSCRLHGLSSSSPNSIQCVQAGSSQNIVWRFSIDNGLKSPLAVFPKNVVVGQELRINKNDYPGLELVKWLIDGVPTPESIRKGDLLSYVVKADDLGRSISVAFFHKSCGSTCWTTFSKVLANPSPVSKFKSCKELRNIYPGGVARVANWRNIGKPLVKRPAINLSIYNSNKSLDADKDGLACES